LCNRVPHAQTIGAKFMPEMLGASRTATAVVVDHIWADTDRHGRAPNVVAAVSSSPDPQSATQIE
jgi:hypothetical protein